MEGNRCAMPNLIEPVPPSPVEPVTDLLHGVKVVDPYRWLEDQESPRTREWLAAQTRHARAYLGLIPGRERIRERIRELLDVETHDSLQKVGNRYFFRKHRPGQEQPCIYLREGWSGVDQLLVDPAERGTGPYTAVRPACVSSDGGLLLYEVKQGGERTGTFEILDVRTKERLSDRIPQGYLRGFAFARDSQAFYYVHETANGQRPYYRAAYRHLLRTSFDEDQEIFFAGDDRRLRLHLISGGGQMGFLVVRFGEKTLSDFYLQLLDAQDAPHPVISDAVYKFGPVLVKDRRVLAITDRGSSNLRIVEVVPHRGSQADFVDLVPPTDNPIRDWIATPSRIFVSYLRKLQTEIHVFDLSGNWLGQLPIDPEDTVRLQGCAEDDDEIFFEQEAFTKPIQVCSYSTNRGVKQWASRNVPCDFSDFDHARVWFPASDGTKIPMVLVGRREVLKGGPVPTVMTGYGGYGVSMTPQFSVFVTSLMERGCLFALPNIRGGAEFGVAWHDAAKRRNRQVAIDDFLAAASWLIESGRTTSTQFAIFGGSNSGLLVGAALTQRPELFRAVICIAPLLDMVRYHLFNNAHFWQEELGTADDPQDFAALLRYSPYHNIREKAQYPATMIISGDSDQNCNPLHARKMTARLQSANLSDQPILLNYGRFRGHSPVMPLSERVEALADRIAFLCDRLRLDT